MEISVDNIFCKILKATPVEIAVVEANTSGLAKGCFFTKAFKNGHWDGKICFYNKKTGLFPTGLLGKIIKVFVRSKLSVHVEDTRLKPCTQSNTVSLEGVELRSYQEACVELCTEKYNRGIIACAVNSGKTEIAIAIVKKLGIKSLWITDSVSLLSQTYARFHTRLGTETLLGTISEGKFNPGFITIASLDTLWSRYKKALSDPKAASTIQLYKFFESVELVINDECAKVPAVTWYTILSQLKNAYYRYGLSGSPFKGTIEDYYLIGTTGEIIYKITSQQLIAMGISSRPVFEIVEIKLPTDPVLYKASWLQARTAGIVKNKHRNAVIVTRAIQHSGQGERVVILFTMIEHGNLLFADLYSALGDKVDMLTGKQKNTERQAVLAKFKAGSVILASNIFDEGIDIKGGIDYLILAGGGKSDQKSIQRVGRATRMNARGIVNILDFKDNTNKILSRHSRQRIRSYSDEGFM